MARKPPDLWAFHSLVADYVMPSKELCLALVKGRIDVSIVRERIRDIQPDQKIRKKLCKEKNYYYFGEAFIHERKSDKQLNPLRANWHHRFVRHADEFYRRLQALKPDDASNFDLMQAAAIAREFGQDFLDCTITRLKQEVRAAEKILTVAGPHWATGPHAVAIQKTKVQSVPEGPSKTSSRLTVPQLAKEWGCSKGKIYTLIHNNDLRAIDISTGRGTRPRYLLMRSAIEEFEQRRAKGPAVAQVLRKPRRQKSDGVTEFF